MRKILISIIVCILLIGSVFLMVNGSERFNIQRVYDLKDENEKVDKKISELSNLISVTYQKTESNLDNTVTALTNSKTEYENQAILSNPTESGYASQLEKYEIDFLWTKLGNFAKENNVIIKIDVTKNETSADLYDLNFYVTGDYVNITDFVYAIENDSKLGFKIDEFKMSVSDNILNATFICKEVSLNVGEIESSVLEESNSTNK